MEDNFQVSLLPLKTAFYNYCCCLCSGSSTRNGCSRRARKKRSQHRGRLISGFDQDNTTIDEDEEEDHKYMLKELTHDFERKNQLYLRIVDGSTQVSRMSPADLSAVKDYVIERGNRHQTYIRECETELKTLTDTVNQIKTAKSVGKKSKRMGRYQSDLDIKPLSVAAFTMLERTAQLKNILSKEQIKLKRMVSVGESISKEMDRRGLQESKA